MTEVIKNDLGEAVRLLTEQLRQIAINKCQFDLYFSLSLDSRVEERWRMKLRVLGSNPNCDTFFKIEDIVSMLHMSMRFNPILQHF